MRLPTARRSASECRSTQGWKLHQTLCVCALHLLDDRKYLVAWEGYPNEFDSWRPARDLLQETIDEAEKEFGGAEASNFPLHVGAHTSDAGVSLSSVNHLVARRVVSNSVW